MRLRPDCRAIPGPGAALAEDIPIEVPSDHEWPRRHVMHGSHRSTTEKLLRELTVRRRCSSAIMRRHFGDFAAAPRMRFRRRAARAPPCSGPRTACQITRAGWLIQVASRRGMTDHVRSELQRCDSVDDPTFAAQVRADEQKSAAAGRCG